ncbi:HTH-type transcriptional regulator CymR [Andreesenia angusta]|uniref:HTH-type transcriptional regulator CymR n=1 Tax=Andreesenia angusta TaxID=39480 RepID=A0A1S1V932_9FIRM|nr:Rrf2 family transcriptional regulator [Andreesenia angusta]OHW63014.1 HTH-type transcriptional regulator CymR [Andreesenia angusta]
MKLSTKGRYGLKAMFELALHYGEGPIPLKNIAEVQEISEHYLEQLIAVLKKNGLVSSVRGAQGGYMLIDSPRKITVGNVIRALEGDLAPVDCINDTAGNKCSKENRCVTRMVWEKINDSINSVIDSITLEDMIEEHNRINSNSDFMYYI